MPSWWDRFGERWAKSGLVDDPTFAQADAGWAFIGQAPPTVEQFNSMFQWVDDKDNWLFGQMDYCINQAGLTADPTDLSLLWKAITSLQRRKLDADTAFYVNATQGSDVTGNGTVNNPWRTIQHAIQYIYTYIDIAGRNCIIQLAPGTYEPFVHWQTINGNLVVQGDPANQRSYLIKSTNGNSIVAVAAAVLYIQGLSVEATSPDPVPPYVGYGVGVFADRAGLILYDAISFGPCTFWHLQIGTMGYVHPINGVNTRYTIYGGAKVHAFCTYAGVFTCQSINITIQNNPNFSMAFYMANTNGQFNASYITYTGTAVGKKYDVGTGAFLFTSGNLNNIPGTIAGTVDAGSFGYAN